MRICKVNIPNKTHTHRWFSNRDDYIKGKMCLYFNYIGLMNCIPLSDVHVHNNYALSNSVFVIH